MSSTDPSFKEKYGPWALITGTTGGIGDALANQLAEKGLNLVLVARRLEILEQQAIAFKDQYQVDIKIICADLANPKSRDKIIEETEGLDIGFFIPNAGIEVHGRFTDHSFEEERKMLQVNVVSTLELTHYFAKRFASRKKGGILLLSSMGGFFGNGYLSGYVATKSYLMTLGESLHYEMKSQGVTVSVLAPGLTDTAMADSVIAAQSKRPPMMSADEVARIGLKKFGKYPVTLPGRQNKLIIFLTTRLFGRRRAAKGATAFLKKFFKIRD